LQKLSVNHSRIEADLSSHFEVVAEAVQTILRRTRSGDAYEQLKQLTRGRKLGPEQLRQFVATLDVSDEMRERLSSITPATFVGPVF
jgi:adenylosuccinate lyase